MTSQTTRVTFILTLAAALALAAGCSDDSDPDGGGGGGDATADGKTPDFKQQGLPKDYKPYSCKNVGKACNAHDACAMNPVCGKDLKCWPAFLMNCDDGLSCTTDTCAGMGLCANKPKTDYCVVGYKESVDGGGFGDTVFKCVTKGTKKPDDPCLACNPTESDAGQSDNKKWMPISGGKCDDLNTCTRDDTCVNGTCKGTYYGNLCADGIGCTLDICDGKGGCLGNKLKSDYCLISGECHKNHGKHPAGSCFECDVTKSQSAWTAITNTCLIDGKCYNNGDPNSGKCAQCDTKTSTTAWTVKGSFCLIEKICKKPGDKDPIGCATCDPTKNKYGWTPIAGLCKIGGKCYTKGAKHPGLCAECDPNTSSTSWTVKGSNCLIHNVCKKPGDKDSIACGSCDPTKAKYGWTPIAGLCKIGGACYKNGELHPGKCAVCDTKTSSTSWTVKGVKHCLIHNVCRTPGTKDLSGCGSCNPAQSKYAWSALAGLCKIDGKCHAKGAKHPKGCGSCDPTKSTTAWTISGTGCLIDQQCYSKNTNHPACGSCDPTKSKTSWTIPGNSCLSGTACYAQNTQEPGGCGICQPKTSKLGWTKPKGCLAAHAWSRSFGDYGYDYGYGVGTDASGNVYVAGYFTGSTSTSYKGISFGGQTHYSVGSYDIFIASYTPSGQYRWSKTFGSTSSDYLYDLHVDNAGNVYITGGFYNSINFGGGAISSKGSVDIFVASFTSEGKHRWSKGFGDYSGDYGWGVATDSAGNVYLTGYIYGSTSTSYKGVSFGGSTLYSKYADIFVASFTSTGKHRWSKSFGDKSSDYGYDIAVDSAGNVYVTGYFYGSSSTSYPGVNFGGGLLKSKGSGDIFIASFNTSGTHRWSKSFGDLSSDYGYGVAVDPSGNVYLTGYFYSSTSTSYKGVDFGGGVLKSKGYGDSFIASFTPGGTHRWSKNWGSSSYDYGYGIAAGPKGNVYITGSASSGANFGGGTLKNNGGYDIYVASYTSGGVHRWSRAHGDASSDYGRKIAVDPYGDVVVAGYFYTYTSSSYKGVDMGGGKLKSNNSNEIFLLKIEQ